jgi:hypothetical protein
MTEKKKSVKKKKESTKKADPAKSVPLEEKTAKKPQKASGKSTEKKQTKKAESVAPVPDKKEEEKKEEKNLGPLSGCKVFGNPDPHHKKCRMCKDLQSCLALELMRNGKKESRKTGQQRGKDFIGFLKGSNKSKFALQIAKNPCHMREIVSAPWNKQKLTAYDTFNELRRNVDDNEEPLPLAAKDKSGKMFILESNLTPKQREQMKKEVSEFTE